MNYYCYLIQSKFTMQSQLIKLLIFPFFLLLAVPVFSNIVTNGDFESNLDYWGSWFDEDMGYTASFQTTNTEVYSGLASGEVIINSIGADVAYHRIMIKNTSFTIEAGEEYEVSFFLKSNATNSFSVQIHQDTSPYTLYSNQTFTASTTWQQYTFSFTSPVTTSDVRFAFKLGNSVANYYLDEIEITESLPEQYTTVIDPDYSIDWSQVGIPGGIPDVPTTVNVLDYGAVGNGSTDNLNAFNNALAAANYGEAVLVPAGDYRINGKLDMPEGVVLRGECPSNTKLLFSINASTPCIDILTYEYGTFTPVTGGFGKGSTSITVNDAAGFSIGEYVEIQQENDPVLMYTDPAWNESWAANAVGQLFIVTGKSGNQIELDRPIFYSFNAAMNPEARPIGLINNVGIENLYLERLDASDGPIVQMKNAANCWMRNVESNMTYRAHVYVARSIDCEIRASYFHHSHDYGGGGHGYGVNLTHHATSVLVENNIFEYLRHAMLIQLGATGNVFGYNYSTAPFWSNSSTNIPPDISMHGHFPTMNLFEGNIVQEATYSDYWGPVGPGNTMFRNRVESSNIYVGDHSHHQNVIANELTEGTTTIEVASNVQNTWSHSNNENGLINPTTSASLPASLYYTSSPDFLQNYPFPAFGPDVILGTHSIPAKDRFDDNAPMLTCYCTPSLTCFDNEFTVNLKLLLEGAFDMSSTQMNTNLFDRGLLPGMTPSLNVPPTPDGHPYTAAPWNYTGTEGTGFSENDYLHTINGMSMKTVDWLLLSFRTTQDAASTVARTAGLLLQDGSVVLFVDNNFINALPADFYLMIENRNHLPVMSHTKLSIVNNELSHDFTTQNSFATGAGVASQELMPGIWGLYGGNGSQALDTGYDINGQDNVAWTNGNGNFGLYTATDHNFDGEVNGADKIIWLRNNGYFSFLERY